jgi:hypothetical protein
LRRLVVVKGVGAQAELVRDLVSAATGASFEIIQQSADRPIPIHNLEWFIRCRKLGDIERVPYLNSVWKVKDGRVWLESLALGDTFEWISSAYGEEAAEDSLDFNYSGFIDDMFRREFEAKYPVVARRIKVCESVAEQVSREKGVHLELRASGSKGIVVFTLASWIQPVDSSLKRSIEAVVVSLKVCYERAMESLT